ncbi:MAG TPA: DNA-binding protein WhiA, partial [Bacilli bacterium]|nr:DNA-binding protein WhiA [Bacilli bacterium]
MTFTMKVKEELAIINPDPIESRIILAAYLNVTGKKSKNNITFVIENAKIARMIYKIIKETYNTNINITVRNQKRFRIKQIYILKIKERTDFILGDLKTIKNTLESNEEKASYLKGAFLGSGNISDPATSGYHFEILTNTKTEADFINKILLGFKFRSKIIIRDNGYMIYIKASENISDILKTFNAYNSLFYFEDIRIYKDHKNMVNRLNNCELANQEKVIKTGLNQIKNIEYLKNNDLISLLDEKTQEVAKYRL